MDCETLSFCFDSKKDFEEKLFKHIWDAIKTYYSIRAWRSLFKINIIQGVNLLREYNRACKAIDQKEFESLHQEYEDPGLFMISSGNSDKPKKISIYVDNDDGKALLFECYTATNGLDVQCFLSPLHKITEKKK